MHRVIEKALYSCKHPPMLHTLTVVHVPSTVYSLAHRQTTEHKLSQGGRDMGEVVHFSA